MTLEKTPTSLEAVKKAFEDFRKTKSHRGRPYPESLWQMARALTPTYTHIQIYHALGITYGLCKRHVLQKPTTHKPKPQRFVPLPIPIPSKVIAKAALPNGIVLEFLCPSALNTLMSASYATTHTTL